MRSQNGYGEMESLILALTTYSKTWRSSCESDLRLENGNYDRELAKEHEEFGGEIYQLVKNSEEYSELERR